MKTKKAKQSEKDVEELQETDLENIQKFGYSNNLTGPPEDKSYDISLLDGIPENLPF